MRCLNISIISYAPVKFHRSSAGVKITNTSPICGVLVDLTVNPPGPFVDSSFE